MTIKDCIDIVDSLKPNQYTIKDKVMWLSFIDEIIINEVLKTHEGYDGRYDNFEGYSEDKLSVPLIVPSPYDRLYTAYLKMKIDAENGETARYNNSAALYNTYMLEFRKHYNKTHMPLDTTNKPATTTHQDKATTGLSDAEYENIIKDLTFILTEYFGKFVSREKLYDIVVEYAQNNTELLKGDKGDDGISPSVALANIEGGHRITFTDAQGKKHYDVNNGKDGKDGKDGVGISEVVQVYTSYESEGINEVALVDAEGNMVSGVFEVRNGKQGARGPQGPEGPKGDKGEKGNTGDTGPIGPRGPQGETGAPLTFEMLSDAQKLELKGDAGPQGPRGIQGEKGNTGPQGPQGPKGDKGAKGDTGGAFPIRGNEIGHDVYINDVSKEMHELEVKVKSDNLITLEEISVRLSGKNLLPMQDVDFSYNGLTFTSKNGELVINGTATSDIYMDYSGWKEKFYLQLNPGTYSATLTNTGTNVSGSLKAVIRDVNATDNNHIVTFGDVDAQTTKIRTFSLTEAMSVYVGFYIKKGVTFLNTCFQLQIEHGNIGTDFEASDVLIVNADAEGNVQGLTSRYPDMYIGASHNAYVDCSYNKDTEKAMKAYIDEAILGGEW